MIKNSNVLEVSLINHTASDVLVHDACPRPFKVSVERQTPKKHFEAVETGCLPSLLAPTLLRKGQALKTRIKVPAGVAGQAGSIDFQYRPFSAEEQSNSQVTREGRVNDRAPDTAYQAGAAFFNFPGN